MVFINTNGAQNQNIESIGPKNKTNIKTTSTCLTREKSALLHFPKSYEHVREIEPVKGKTEQ